MTGLAVWQRRLLPFLVFCVTLALWSTRVCALEVPPLQGQINDQANLLSPDVEQRLTQRLISYENATGHQLAVLTITSLGGDPIEDFGIRVVEQWKLGKKGKDDGVLVLVAAKDHKMRIEVGYGLEGELPDVLAGRIVRDQMAPRFRQGDYAGGIEAAVDQIMARTGGAALVPNTATTAPPAPGKTSTAARPNPLGHLGLLGVILAAIFKFAFFGIFLIILVIVVLINLFGGTGRYRGRSGGVFFGGGGLGGGGGFSGGGGGFGGGGASGDW